MRDLVQVNKKDEIGVRLGHGPGLARPCACELEVQNKDV